ncbi:MAG TPA: response regulator transcription factor [Dehalococcoidia bacterium]|nr:response regulator transcription factor [Dehalococcoidia bacterium]
MAVTQDRILIVEDEPTVAEVVDRYLRRDGYDVSVAHDGIQAMEAYDRVQPDLVVLDVMLPGLDGMEVCRQIRSRATTPIIMLTARGDEVDKLVGLQIGADDYVTKPFSPRELAARVKAVLRRSSAVPQDGDALRFNGLRISGRTRTVQDGRGVITLTAREFDLLFFLARHAGQVFSREQLLDNVWDFEFPGDSSTVTVHMRRLRSKVETDPSRPRHLKTVWGVGYKFEP